MFAALLSFGFQTEIPLSLDSIVKPRRLDAQDHKVAFRKHRAKEWRVLCRLITLLPLTWFAAACNNTLSHRSLDRLHPCLSSEGPTDALCGTVTVFENRHTAIGRQIQLWVVVLPSLSNTPSDDPLFFLAGGPGQAAAQLASQIRAVFRQVQRTRDIVLVDQRGTGKSNPLNCRSSASSLRELTEGSEVALARLRRCLEGYNADVRLYTTDVAMDDLDDVRAFLGYDRINLYGGSYGTRAALVYLRQHSEHVRSIVLDGVAPTDMRLPLFTARDAQHALDKALSDCDAESACSETFPGMATRIRNLIVSLEQHPRRVRIVHPRTGIAEDVDVDARLVSSVMFSALYSPLTASIVPALVDRAEQNDFQGVFALALAGEDGGENMSIGMQLSVLCSEDASRVSADELARETSHSVFGSHLIGSQLDACAMWPKAKVKADYYKPVVSDVPVLVLSGEVDPVTPPIWGASVVKHLSHGMHIVVPSTGHGVVTTPCGNRLVSDFIERGSAESLDTTCVASVRRPPFFVTPAGPDPLDGNIAK
jgi:pimeloyl-ACP methyl ester carboxylesterase